VIRRRSQRYEYHSPFYVKAHARPAVNTANVLPRIGRPRLIARFTRMWYRMKGPHQLARPYIVCSDVAGFRSKQFGYFCSKNQEVFVHDARRRGYHGYRLRISAKSDVHAHPTVLSKTCNEFSCNGILCEQIVSRRVEYTFVISIFPIGYTTIDSTTFTTIEWIVGPT